MLPQKGIKSKDWEYANHVTTPTHSVTLKALADLKSLIGVIVDILLYYQDWVFLIERIEWIVETTTFINSVLHHKKVQGKLV